MSDYKTVDQVRYVIATSRQEIAKMRLRRHCVAPWRAANLDRCIEEQEAMLARDIAIWQGDGWDVA